MTNRNNERYPDEFDEEPPANDTSAETTLIRVKRYDRNDVLLGTQYFVLMQDDDSHIITSMLRATEPEQAP